MTWFERGRRNSRLETLRSRVIFDLWDDAVTDAIDGGFLPVPRVPNVTHATDADWQSHAVAYARDASRIGNPPHPHRRNPSMAYIDLGPVPVDEPCAQVGTVHYLAISMRECEVFRRMLARLFAIPQGLPVQYVIRSHHHDFGIYREVAVRYCDEDPAAVDFAHGVERATPERWDPVARQELDDLQLRQTELAVRHVDSTILRQTVRQYRADARRDERRSSVPT